MNLTAMPKGADPAIERHLAIGDRRTGALVAADGALNWWCLPDFDGPPIFDALLDRERGGFCRLGPAAATPGGQLYLPDTTAAVTRWIASDPSVEIEVTDLMAWPDDERTGRTQNQRVILRRLRVIGGAARVVFAVSPRWNFAAHPSSSTIVDGGVEFAFRAGTLGVWTDFPLTIRDTGASAEWTVAAGEEHWVVLGWNASPADWSTDRCASIFQSALRYWQDWSAGLDLRCVGERAEAARRAALTAHLLTHARHGSAVASLTTSLPERIGGDRNYDYRLAWIRDGSLALAMLAQMGKVDHVRCYLNWLAGLDSETDSPLHVVYGVDGRMDLDEDTVEDVPGYGGSLPVRIGNRAAKQRQLCSLMPLADCVQIYLKNGGRLESAHWSLIERAADYTVRNWNKTDSGIWELDQKAHYVSSRAACWVILDRAGWIARHTDHGEAAKLAGWDEEAARIHAEVMDRGWCEDKKAFRQRYDSEALDASALLIPLLGFLPPDHPRCLDTLAAIERELVLDHCLYRFEPTDTLGGKQLPLGEFEGAFLPCVFWYAHLLALLGRVDEARAMLARCDAVAGPAGLLAEEIDPRRNTFLGNTPLLFSHFEYIGAAFAIHHATPSTNSSA